MKVHNHTVHAEQIPAKARKLTTELVHEIRGVVDKIDDKTHAAEEVAEVKRRKIVAMRGIGKFAGTGFHAVSVVRSNLDPTFKSVTKRAKLTTRRRRAMVPIIMGAALSAVLLRRYRAIRVPRFLTSH